MKNKLKIILPVILISSAAFVLFQSQKNVSVTNEDPVDKSNQIKNTDENTTQVNFQSLSILGNRCRGCGRCVQIDPSHFEMNNRVAVVTSSTNLDSSSLTLAINNCPANAIILE
ncbi:MAG: ferredoxin [Candidatus Shapirobacteria bacterium]|nr:ferredoxin [Candidatus Shapirobacteria bacterium]